MTTTLPAARLAALAGNVGSAEQQHRLARDNFYASMTGFGPLDAHQRELMAAYDLAAMQLGEARHMLGKARLEQGLPY